MEFMEPVLTFLSFLVGAACAWGMMRQTVARLVVDVDKLSTQICRTAEALAHLDLLVKDVSRLSQQVDRSNELFKEFELECRTRFAAEDARRQVRRKRK